MYELLYTSVSQSGFSESELFELLESARIKNKKLNITGMLVYHEHEIMQILEGPEEAVKELYQTIAMDDRHMSIEVFYQGHIEERSFKEWSMAFKLLNHEEAQQLIEGFQSFEQRKSPINMIKSTPSRGKKSFLWLLGRI